ncbi:MAG: shikimate dehydrogenase, partial [Clostridia bacterium]|nr:shikimate dehydrogenase [Clostridia bacterium]
VYFMNYKLGLLAQDMHNSVLPAAYDCFCRSLGHEMSFKIYNVRAEQLAPTVNMFRDTLDGFTVTMPYKVRIMDFCDEMNESAEKCMSVNTVLVRNGKLIGYNTDGWGFIKSLQLNGADFAGKRAVLVGAGGVAMSIAYNLLINGVRKVDVLNLFPNETERLVSRMGKAFEGHMLTDEALSECAGKADAFINASVLGQVGFDDYADLDFLKKLPPDAVVFDVNYSNPDAKLLPAARALGLRAYSGRAMSSCQGIRAMEIWTGMRPSDETVSEFLRTLE